MEGSSSLLKMVQEKLNEKEEIIHEQQRQISDLFEKIARLEENALAYPEALAEKDEVIRELMEQQVDSTGATDGDTEKDELIREQMGQIVEITERLEALQIEHQRAEEKLREFDKLQNQLKDLLGES
ncbi:hypothetical protein BH09SUM1_BH09SUM1_10440 [soil metagenome]